MNEIPGMVHNAFREMSSGRPRPVEIEIPWDVLPMTDDTELPEPEGPGKQQPEPALIREAAQLLAGASRPLIWAGGGTRDAAVTSELLELAEALNAPVITTPEGKGAIPENSPPSLGSFYYAHGPGHIALPQADVILAIGSRMMFTPNVPWGIQPHQKVVQIDADHEELGRNIPATVGIAADARLGVQALLAELGGRTQASQWTETEITAIRQQADREIREMAPLQVAIIETIRHELDDDAIMVAGTTDIGYWSHLAYPVLAPRSYLTSSYFATLGYAFPRPWEPKSATPAGRSLPQQGWRVRVCLRRTGHRCSGRDKCSDPCVQQRDAGGVAQRPATAFSAAESSVPGSTIPTSPNWPRYTAPWESDWTATRVWGKLSAIH